MTQLNSSHIQVVKLPELLALVGSYLDSPDLLSCVQIIDYPRHNHTPLPSDMEKDEDWLRGIFSKYGHHIRHLCADRAITLTIASSVGTCTNLKTLPKCLSASLHFGDKFRSDIFKDYGQLSDHVLSTTSFPSLISPTSRLESERAFVTWILMQRCWILVQQNPSLETLELAKCFRTNHNSFPTNFFLQTLVSLSHLTSIINDAIEIPLQLLLQQLPQLQHYSCHTHSCDPANTNFINDMDLDTPFPQLLTLNLGDRTLWTIECKSILNLLRYLPNLQKLTLSWLQPLNNPTIDVGALIGHSPSRLQELTLYRIHRYPNIEDSRCPLVHHILPWLPFLTKLTIDMKLNTPTALALVNHCPQLMSVQYLSKSNSDITPDDVSSAALLLHNMPNLKVLDMPCQTVELDSLLDAPFACTGLEVLRCQIEGFNRFDVEEEAIYKSWLEEVIRTNRVEKNNPQDTITDTALQIYGARIQEILEKYVHCREQHRRFYDAIGGLIHLKKLELGVDKRQGYERVLRVLKPYTYTVGGRIYYMGFGPTPNTPLLDLDSGLDRLKTLKELKVFGFEGVDHRIDKPELDWIAMNWPQLEVLCGLEVPQNPHLFLHCPKTDELRVHMQKLRPSIQHQYCSH
ncbi:hypothetical protein FBU30_000719 [Linnemannia zychae]|nr:hypothetical protein FBU30_000719 [Linnemannia zychae]